MCRHPTRGEESDQLEEHLLISLSTPAVPNVLLMQDSKFHFSSQISRVRCHAIRYRRKRDTAKDSCPHQDHTTFTKKGKEKADPMLGKWREGSDSSRLGRA